MAQGLRQQVRHAAGYKMPQRHLGEKAHQAVGGHHQVAVEHPLKATAHRVAVHRAHHQFWSEHDVAGDLLDALAVQCNGGRALGLLLKLLQVVAGAKGAAGAGQHNSAGGRVRLRLHQCGVQVHQQVAADSVQTLGTVQGNHANAAFGTQLGKSHGGYSVGWVPVIPVQAENYRKCRR